MKLTRHYLHLCTIASLWLLLTGCNHKNLYVEIGEQPLQVYVDFDFSETTQTPTSMRVYFYPVIDGNTSSQPLRFDLPPSGGVVQLSSGDYRVLAFNVDAENIIGQDDDLYDQFLLTTAHSDIKVTEQEDKNGNRASRRQLFGSNVPIGEDEQPDYPMYDMPEWTCVCHIPHFRVDPPISTGDINVSGSSLTLDARDAVKQVEFELSGIEGVKNALILRGTLSGIPVAYQMAMGRPVNEVGLMTFAARVDEEREIIVGSLSVWGFCPPDDPDARQYLNIYIWTNGGNYYVTQDVTDQMRNGEDSNQQRIVIQLDSDGLDLTDAGAGDSGFKPSVGTWDEESSNIQL